MFNFLKNSLKKIYSTVSCQFSELFSRASVDEQTLDELQTLLLQADTGVTTTRSLINHLRQYINEGRITEGIELRQAIRNFFIKHLSIEQPTENPVLLLVGVNGSGKTTCAAKLANLYQQKGKKVLLVAADTFRAAAQEQLNEWAAKLNIQIEGGQPNQDPASVVYKGCQRYQDESFDMLIVDTAGRLQTKTHLMHELEKIKRVITKKIPGQSISSLLTVDGMLGQNSFDQVQLFHEHMALDGIVLTKMDGTGKGGIVFAIAQELKVPVAYLSYGEQPEQIKLFDARSYVTQLLQS